MSLLWVGSSVAQSFPTHFTNIGSIANTRHNLTQSTATVNPTVPAVYLEMDKARNDYGEVCVYCHTPHAANTTIALPLWNRTNKATTYNTYNSSTLTQPVSQPGPNSLSCLSCHDGTVAIDSIINMPGSGGYNAAQETQGTGDLASQKASGAFLDTWKNSNLAAGRQNTTNHLGLNSNTRAAAGTLMGDGLGTSGCIGCHNDPATTTSLFYAGVAADFTIFNIGTDLRNDHPVGIRYPAMGPGVDFRPTTGVLNNIAYFDTDGNGKMEPKNLRLYNTGQGYEVECASCHDPHGVAPGTGPTPTTFNKTFMRVSNSGSDLCLTCHVK